jgi:uncharacterized protein (TIGR02147 family)
MAGLSIFDYEDYRSFLRAYYEQQKRQKSQFSLRFWAKQCGFAAPDYLLRVMRGERNLSEAGVLMLSKSMRLGEKDVLFFAALVAFNQAGKPAEKETRWQSLLRLRSHSATQRLRQDQFDVLSDWRHVALRSLLPVLGPVAGPSGGDLDHESLGRYLDPPATGRQIKEAVAALERLGLLRRNGRRYEVEQGQLTTGDEVASMALAAFHRSLLQLASRSIDEHAPSQRDVSGVTASLSAKGVQKVKARIQAFRKEVQAIAAEDAAEDRVYHLGLYFFPLTRTGGWQEGRR